MTAAAILAAQAIPEPPPTAARYGPGPVPGSIVVDGEGNWMREDAGLAFLRAVDRLAAEGIHLGVRSATRTNAEQWVLWNRKQAAPNDPRVPTAAYPGTSSHEWQDGNAGTAVDVDPPYGGRRAEVLREEGFRDTVPKEPWHFNYLRNG